MTSRYPVEYLLSTEFCFRWEKNLQEWGGEGDKGGGGEGDKGGGGGGGGGKGIRGGKGKKWETEGVKKKKKWKGKNYGIELLSRVSISIPFAQESNTLPVAYCNSQASL